MKLIVGLGNPEQSYAKTRHNVGFIYIDAFAQVKGIVINHQQFQGIYYKGPNFILAKPLTYMNNSGFFVQSMLHFFKIGPEDLLVIHDDMDYPLGKVVMKLKGSSGGHNGVQNIIDCLATPFFNRLKIGIGRPQFGVVDYVLGNFSLTDLNKLKELEKEVFNAIENFINYDVLVAKRNLEQKS